MAVVVMARIGMGQGQSARLHCRVVSSGDFIRRLSLHARTHRSVPFAKGPPISARRKEDSRWERAFSQASVRAWRGSGTVLNKDTENKPPPPPPSATSQKGPPTSPASGEPKAEIPDPSKKAPPTSPASGEPPLSTSSAVAAAKSGGGGGGQGGSGAAGVTTSHSGAAAATRPVSAAAPASGPMSSANTSSSTPPPMSSPPPAAGSSSAPKKRSLFLRTLITLLNPAAYYRGMIRFFKYSAVALVFVFAYLAYCAWEIRHPQYQLPFDPSKKTIVVLGTGWGSTSFLKGFDSSEFNVLVVSRRGHFLFTPLLPSTATGTIELRSILEPIRYILRRKPREARFYEAEAIDIDTVNKSLTVEETIEGQRQGKQTTIDYDYLICAVGAVNNTFGIKGVEEHALFLKDTSDSRKIRNRIMDCVESATFKDQSPEEIERLLHIVVVGGGPTGTELSTAVHDHIVEDLARYYENAGKMKVTLIEALPHVLPQFSSQLVKYSEESMREQNIDLLTNAMVQEVRDKVVLVKTSRGIEEIPYGMLVWSTGNAVNPFTKMLAAKLPEHQNNRRGLTVDDHLVLKGAQGIFALGDCVSGDLAATAQAASQQGQYLARIFNALGKIDQLEVQLHDAQVSGKGAEAISSILKSLNKAKRLVATPFHYTHQGSLAYVGSDKAIADINLPFMSGSVASAGYLTFVVWRSVYASKLFSARNRALVLFDYLKCSIWGRDCSRE